MRILAINDALARGGAAGFTRSAADTLARFGNEVDLVYGLFGPEDRNAISLELGVNVLHASELSPAAGVFAGLSVEQKVRGSEEVHRGILDLVASRSYDAIYCLNLHEFFSIRLLPRLRAAFDGPIVFQVNDNDLFCLRKYNFIDEQRRACRDCITDPTAAIRNGCGAVVGAEYANANLAVRAEGGYRRAIEACDAFIVTSEGSAELLGELGVDSDRIVVGNNPLDVAHFPTGPVGDHLVFYGMPLLSKGIETLAQALQVADVQAFHLYLLGENPAVRDPFSSIAAQRGFQLEVHSDITWQNGLFDRVSTARAVVVPSQWDAPSEMVVSESISMGRALVVSDKAARTPLVRPGENALVFPADDPHALARCLSELAADPPRAAAMGAASRAIAERELTPERWYASFEEAVAPRTRKAAPVRKAAVPSEPLVTAIVSTYNAERFLHGCLADLEAQTIADRLEIVVIDSGSQQDERAIVEEFQREHGNIVYLRTERESLYAAWNRGIALARGTYVTNANTDDRHRPDALERLARALEERPDAALAYADCAVTLAENATLPFAPVAGHFRWPEFDPVNLFRVSCIGPQPLWRRALHDVYGRFDPDLKIAGDYDWWLRLARAESFVHVPEVLGLYLWAPDSIEHREPERCAREAEEVRAKWWPYEWGERPAPGGNYLVPVAGPTEVAPRELDARPVRVLALANELARRPELLEAYRGAVGNDRPVTLVVYGRNAEPGAVAESLERAGLDTPDAPDVLVVTGPGDLAAERGLARASHALLSTAPADRAFELLPRFDASNIERLAA